MVTASRTATVEDFLIELDASLAYIPKKQFEPLRSPEGLSPEEFMAEMLSKTRDAGQAKETTFSIGTEDPDAPGEYLTFAVLGNVHFSENRAIAVAHILNNIHVIRKQLERAQQYAASARKALDVIRGGNVDGKEYAQQAIQDLDAMSDQVVRRD